MIPGVPFLARFERFERVGSTNDVVRGWLDDGTAEVCLAVADEQTAGRGRDGRSWTAPPGGAVLLSVGFRPTWLEADAAWRLAAVVSLAMAEAAEASTRLADGTVRLKWPNDLMIDGPDGPRKLAGVLGETVGLGGPDPRVVVGLGINTGWTADAFPSTLAATMTSLREAGGLSAIDDEALLEAFVARLESGVTELQAGRFDGAGWARRQVTTDRLIRLERPDRAETVRAAGVDPASGALLVADGSAAGGVRPVLVGEITHVRLVDRIAEAV